MPKIMTFTRGKRDLWGERVRRETAVFKAVRTHSDGKSLE
jgi:hypothetical protein